MSTDEKPAGPPKVIAMLKRKMRRRPDKRFVAESISQLQAAICSRNIELGRVRNNYERLEVAFVKQHHRNTIKIERLERVYTEIVNRKNEMQEEWDSYTHTQRAFSGPNYELSLLKDILKRSDD